MLVRFMTLQRYLSILSAVLLAAALSPTQAAQAQKASAPVRLASAAPVAHDSSTVWAAGFGEQLRYLLEQPDRQRQEHAMLLILEHMRRPTEAAVEAAVDLRPTVTPLFDIYASDAPQELRLLALAALSEIGEAYVMRQLAQRVQQEAPGPVRRQTLRVLAHRME